MTEEKTPPLTGHAVEEHAADPPKERTAETAGDVTEGDPSMVGGGPGGEKELAGADALGGSDADIGRGGD